MKMNINVEITDPEIIGEIFAMFGRSKQPVDLVVEVDEPKPRNATPPPPPTDDPPEYVQPVRPTEVTMAPEKQAPEKKRGRPAKAEPPVQPSLPAGDVTATQMMAALTAYRGQWGIDAARTILREVGGAEKPADIPQANWSAVVDACNAAPVADMSEFM